MRRSSKSPLDIDITLTYMFTLRPPRNMVSIVSRNIRGDSVALMGFLTELNIAHTDATTSEYRSRLRFRGQAKVWWLGKRVALYGAETVGNTVYVTQQQLPGRKVMCSSRGFLADDQVHVICERDNATPARGIAR